MTDIGSKEFIEYADKANIPNSYRIWANCMWMEAQKQAINTPKHETVSEELREAYELIVNCGYEWQTDTEEYMCKDCIEIGNKKEDVEHHESCKVLKAFSWLKNNKIEGKTS